MDIPKKYRLNTEDFKIYFDNEKKTHVAQNLDTGERTNIGALGIFLQMGILQSLEQEDKLQTLTQKIAELEQKINQILDSLKNLQTKPIEPEVDEEKVETEEKKIVETKEIEQKKEKPKFNVKEKIMEKALKKISDEEETLEDIVTETEEEIDAWEEI